MFLALAAGILIAFEVYLFGMVYDNGFNSKRRKFRIASKYYDDHQVHKVQWKLLWLWHDYITDAHYMEYAVFIKREDALEFIWDKKHGPKLIKEEITDVS